MLKLPSSKQVGLSAVFITLLTSLNVSADIVKIDGSSTVFPITEAVAEDFQKKKGALLGSLSAFRARVEVSRSSAVAKSI